LRTHLAVLAGLLFTGVAAVPAQAAEPARGAYWRVETVVTKTHDRPVGSGYWLTERNVTADWTTPKGESWTAYRNLGARPKTKKDEAAWRADGSPTSWTYRTEGMKVSVSMKPNKGLVKKDDGPRGFMVAGEKKVTYEELQNLPSDPAALRQHVEKDVRDWIGRAVEDAKTTAPGSKADEWLVRLDRYVAEGLTGLLYQNPVPKKVREAAYQALRSTKGVADLGRTKDPLGRAGQAFALPPLEGKGTVVKQRVVVDPATMTLLAKITEATGDGKPFAGKSLVETYTAGWTDERPAVPAVR